MYFDVAFLYIFVIFSKFSIFLFTVVRQGYQVQVYDEFVIRGNTAVLRCQVPSVVRDYVIVTTWEREDGVTIVSNVANGKLFYKALNTSIKWVFFIINCTLIY